MPWKGFGKAKMFWKYHEGFSLKSDTKKPKCDFFLISCGWRITKQREKTVKVARAESPKCGRFVRFGGRYSPARCAGAVGAYRLGVMNRRAGENENLLSTRLAPLGGRLSSRIILSCPRRLEQLLPLPDSSPGCWIDERVLSSIESDPKATLLDA